MAWHDVAGEDALSEDEAIGVVIGKLPIALCRSGGELYALHNVCTHQYALLSDGYVEDGQIECPLHQGRFELRTGKPCGAPVTKPVRVYSVKSEGGRVYVEITE